ncbi:MULTISPECIES: TolB family protein [unclassified Methanosarcina]|uniref:TolB family protein n=1 Tax=unclassified Methanosarcina TaxID=2644672 RepID=UPI000A95F035|nr:MULTISPECIES: TolB family protein [unclassified Methanosarcina]
MLRLLKISLFLILLISSISTGFAASSENLSMSIEETTYISQIVNPYFDGLVESSGTNLKEQPIISGSWSPDSSRLVVEASINSQYGATLHSIYIMNADGSGIRELVSTPGNTKEKSLSLHILENPNTQETTWSPDGNRIGIFANINTVRDFYVTADPDKTLIKTAGECNYTTVDELMENILDIEWQTNFMWNPEGTKALIIMDQNPLNYQLYLLDPDGYVLQQLTDTSNRVETALWSNDGKKIAYSVTGRTEDEETGLWIINENGTENNRLVDKGILIAWSPDDSRIFYVDENFGLYSIKIDGTDEVQLSTSFVRNEDVFSFSPDGKSLIFSTVNDDRVTIFQTDSIGKNAKVLEEFTGYIVFKPRWSPKGDKIAYAQEDNLYTINPDGSEKSLIASAITDYEWHPSGDFISFISSDSVFVASPDGSTKIQLTENGNNYRFLEDRYLRGWSPDGSRLLVRNEFTDLSIIKLEGYEDPLSIDLLTPAEGENCELRVRCMSEPIADALLTLNEKEIGFTNSSGFLNYSCPDAGRSVINASKTGYSPASKVLVVEESSSASQVTSADLELSSDAGNEDNSKSEYKLPGFRGTTLILLLLLFIRRRNSL